VGRRRFLRGVLHLQRAFEISAKVGDFLALFFGNYQLGCALGLDYKLKESLDCFKKSLDLSIKSNNLMGMAHLKSAMAMNYSLQGKSDLALKIIKEAVQEATESGDILAKQPVYTNYGVTCYYKGCLDEAEKNLKEALAYHEKTFQASWERLLTDG